jgi:hypothetical protein
VLGDADTEPEAPEAESVAESVSDAVSDAESDPVSAESDELAAFVAAAASASMV